MRFVSRKTNGYKVYAVTGVNSISFAIDFENTATKGLLGFAVERHDKTENERYFMRGFKVFKDVVPHPTESTEVSTYDHPVQSFVWDDFTGKPDHEYEYFFYPLKGTPQNIDRSESPVKIAVRTELLYDKTAQHDVFFNRGVASSQAFAKRFHNAVPGKTDDSKLAKAMYDWLARDLEKALVAFIDQAEKGDTLLACMYEFHYQPVVDKFKQAIDRGAKVRIIIDAKNNKEKFPRDDNLQAIKKAGIGTTHIIQRTANQNDIQHNKFMVLLKGKSQTPTAVWTGSTNVSEGGIFGQTNVGHWVRDVQTAKHYARYWELLSKDPGGKPDDDRTKKIEDNAAFKEQVVALQQDIEAVSLQKIPQGTTPIFSPRTSDVMLQTYAALLDSAKSYAAITLAFGISDVFKKVLQDNNADSPITFMMLEKKDEPKPNDADAFLRLSAKNNVYEAWGSYIRDSLYQWTKEVNTKALQLNQHVMYIHSKFLLVDPLSADPLIVTGSANFSKASTTANDENMIVIRGDHRAADIYFTEFNRLFNHYYFRSVYEETSEHKAGAVRDPQTANDEAAASLFLLPDDSWLEKYRPGKLRYKRVKALVAQIDHTIT